MNDIYHADTGLSALFHCLNKRARRRKRNPRIAITNRVELAEALGVRKQAISGWKRVPVERVLVIEKLTGVVKHVLRPDIYPPPAAKVSVRRKKARNGRKR